MEIKDGGKNLNPFCLLVFFDNSYKKHTGLWTNCASQMKQTTYSLLCIPPINVN